jgi:hypothetical protein
MDDLGDEDELSEEEDESDEDMEPKSLVVTLRYGKGRSPSAQHSSAPTTSAPPQPNPALSHPTPVLPVSLIYGAVGNIRGRRASDACCVYEPP